MLEGEINFVEYREMNTQYDTETWGNKIAIRQNALRRENNTQDPLISCSEGDTGYTGEGGEGNNTQDAAVRP